MAQKHSSQNATDSFRLKDWHCVGILAVLIAVFFRKILLGEAFFWEDFIYYYYPTKNFAATALAAGKLPLWNPFTFGGMPFLADIQNAVFYPFNLLLALFAGETLSPLAVEYSIVLHFLIAGIGMFYLSKYLHLERLPSLIAATAFMLSGFMVTHAIHQTVISGAAWLPLITLFVLKALRMRSFLNIFFASVILAGSVLAGFPQVSLYTFFFVGCLFLFELVVLHRKGNLREAITLGYRFAVVIGFALAMASIQLLPTMELAPLSNRAAISYEKSLVGSLTWGQLLTLIIPKFFGVSSAEGYNYWGPEAYWHFWETCIYVGIPTMMLAGFTLSYLRREPFWLFLGLVGLFSLLAALGDDFILHRLLFNYAPGFDKFRNPGRFTMLFAFIAPLLAGAGAHHLMFDKSLSASRRKSLVNAGVIPGLAVLIFLAMQGKVLHGSFPFLQSPQVEQFVSSEITIALLIVLASLGIIYVAIRNSLSPTTVGVSLLLLCFIDLYIFGFSQNNGRTNPQDYFRRGENVIRTLLDEGKSEKFRVNSRQGGYMIFDRNQGMLHPLFLLEGYTPLGLSRVWPPVATVEQQLDLLNVRYAIRVDEERQTMGLRQRANYLPRAYVVEAARVFPEPAQIEEYTERDTAYYRRMVILEKHPGIQIPEDTDRQFTPAEILEYESDRIVIAIAHERPAMLVLSEIYYPGWTATANGRELEIIRAHGTLRAVALEQGVHTVIFEFRPSSLHIGMWVSGSAFALCLAIAYFSYRFQRTRSRIQSH
jgi:hypothetical protein